MSSPYRYAREGRRNARGGPWTGRSGRRNYGSRDKQSKAAEDRHPEPMPETYAPVEGVFNLLVPELQAAVSGAGYSAPTPIQEQAIPRLMEARDMVGCAQTGTGKTAAFALPLLDRLLKSGARPESARPHALILAPTRELAVQISDSIGKYSKFTRISQTTVYGGVSQHPQAQALRRGVHIVVATPGRLLDLVGQKILDLRRVEVFVLDEADRMLDMGFMPDIRRILNLLPKERQSLLFSATMPDAIRKLASALVSDPVEVAIEPGKPAVEKIDQKVFFVEKGDKLSLLAGMLRDEEKRRVLVFTQMKHSANTVSKKLLSRGISSVAIHGNKSQGARNRALSDFKQGSARVLVATDVAARGLDVRDISHVINYDIPQDAETYVHRIGRTGRAGADGSAASFCTAEDKGQLKAIERLLKKSVPVEFDHEWHSQTALSAKTSGNRRGSGRFGNRRGRSNYSRRSRKA